MKSIAYAGAKSGRMTDKTADLGLQAIPANNVKGSALREIPLTLECRVVYRQKMDPRDLSEKFLQLCYQRDLARSHPRANKDPHIAYYGEIVASYILKSEGLAGCAY